jgi:hypothetical protein
VEKEKEGRVWKEERPWCGVEVKRIRGEHRILLPFFQAGGEKRGLCTEERRNALDSDVVYKMTVYTTINGLIDRYTAIVCVIVVM